MLPNRKSFLYITVFLESYGGGEGFSNIRMETRLHQSVWSKSRKYNLQCLSSPSNQKFSCLAFEMWGSSDLRGELRLSTG